MGQFDFDYQSVKHILDKLDSDGNSRKHITSHRKRFQRPSLLRSSIPYAHQSANKTVHRTMHSAALSGEFKLN